MKPTPPEEAAWSYTLETPLRLGVETLTTLHFREPRAADVRAFIDASRTPGSALHAALSALCGVPGSIIDSMPAPAYAALLDEFTAFFSRASGVGPQTGG